MLKLVEVDSFYGRSHVLHGVNLDVPAGEITTILGRNGTGKTTLLKTIMGLTDRTNGAIRYDEPRHRRRADIPARALRLCLCAARPRDHSGFHYPREYPARRLCARRRQALNSEPRAGAVPLSDPRTSIAAAAYFPADSSNSSRSRVR